jgi:hypothetical protein
LKITTQLGGEASGHTAAAAHSGRATRGRAAPIVVAAAATILALGALLAWRHSVAFPPCCDVDSYWAIARSYLERGLFAEHQWLSLRTWAYPAFLAIWLQLGEWTGWNPRALLAVVQTVAYLGSAVFVARSVPDPRISVATFVLFACNVFVIPYLAIGLADVLALTLFQVWLGALLRMQRTAATRIDGRGAFGWLALAAACAGAALAIRPAYVWLPFVTVLAILLTSRGCRLQQVVARLCLAAGVIVVPLLPQSAINRVHFDTWSPMPTADLGTMQINWGKANFKYATALHPGAATPALFYPSPFHSPADEDPAAHPLRWYLDHPIAALATVTSKFVGVFDFDFIEPYIHHPDPPLQTPLRLLSLALLVLGLAAMAAQALAISPAAAAPGWRALPLLVLLGWGAVNLVSVPELRFALPMLSLFAVVVPVFARDAFAHGRRTAFVVIASTMAATAALFTIGELVRAGITV